MHVIYYYSYACKPDIRFYYSSNKAPLIKLSLSDDGFGNLIGCDVSGALVFFGLLNLAQCKEANVVEKWYWEKIDKGDFK
jgi:hypothetical protein